MRLAALLLSVIALISLARCGRAAIGQSCATAASTSECVEGAICTNASTGGAYCAQVCMADADCTAPLHCNGIAGTTTKSCQ